jgi:mannose-1-phosphate guanylyltransferase/phosphomannomutase
VVKAAGATLEWSPIALPALMERAADPTVDFAGTADGAFIWPDFMPAPDGLMTFAKALELVAHEERPLADVLEDHPAIHVARRDVRTPWELKGTVMRRLAAEYGVPDHEVKLVLLDGVKIESERSWVLVVPFPDEPLCRIWAETDDPAESEELVERYAALVEQVAAPDSEAT